MIKLVCSYSRKGPGDEEYSSRQYHAGLEMELPEGLTQGQLDAKVHETFGRLRDVVEQELQGKPAPVADTVAPTANRKETGRKISNAQAKFALDLARRNGVTMAVLEQIISTEFHADGLYDLGASQASALIGRLKTEHRKAA